MAGFLCLARLTGVWKCGYMGTPRVAQHNELQTGDKGMGLQNMSTGSVAEALCLETVSLQLRWAQLSSVNVSIRF